MDHKDLERDSATANDSPQNALKFLLNCLYVYQRGGKKGRGEDKALGYIGFVLSKDNLKEDRKSPSGLKPFASSLSLIKGLRQPQRLNAIISSMGATWENNYEDVDPSNYELPIVNEQEVGDRLRITLKAGGRDNPFPITLAQNNRGQWKIVGGFSSLCMDVRRPKAAVGDF
jgi:hypothetical protein